MVERFGATVVCLLISATIPASCDQIRYGKPIRLSAQMGIEHEDNRAKPDLIVTQLVGQKAKPQKHYFPVKDEDSFQHLGHFGTQYHELTINRPVGPTSKPQIDNRPQRFGLSSKRTTERPYEYNPYQVTFKPYAPTDNPELYKSTSTKPYRVTTHPYKVTSKLYPPTIQPYKPTSKPYQPTEKSYKPTSKPYQPTVTPYKPTSTPYKPTIEPYKPTSRPSESATTRWVVLEFGATISSM